MPYELQDHTADVGIEGSGSTLSETFAALADGMAAAMAEDVPDVGDRFEITVAAERREALLFDYLDELIYERDVRNVLPVDNDATVDSRGGEWTLDASARGVPLEAVAAREVKAVTYSEMKIEETASGWRAYVVLDV